MSALSNRSLPLTRSGRFSSGAYARFRNAMGLFLAMACLAGSTYAQNVAQISGTVHDPSGGVLAKAEVKATQADTGIVHTASTDAAGQFVIPELPAGPYQLEVSATGFKTFVQTGIVLQVNASPVVNVTLEIGAVSEQVDVTADAAMVQTSSAGVGEVMENQRVLDLPLNGRQVTDLVLLTGGAILTLNGGVSSGFTSNRNYPTVPIVIAGRIAGRNRIHAGWRHTQRSRNEYKPSGSVSRRAAGI